ncbi:hypothetical protein HDU88_000558 [Geranomyces variabilis]|nr:hypothetical protein HDU88_000558 [Geranomyces variabilis]
MVGIAALVALAVGLSVGLTHRSHANAGPTFGIQAYPALKTSSGTSPDLIASNLAQVRTLVYDNSTGRILALVKGQQRIIAIEVAEPSAADFAISDVVDAAALNLDLNHGLAIDDAYVYASSATTVYRWTYDRNHVVTKPAMNATPTVVVANIDAALPNSNTIAGHITRTIAFHNEWMYISVGSGGNVDTDSHRAKVRRLAYRNATVTYPLDFQAAPVWADGVRNAVALAFDSRGRLWTAVNGPDNLDRPDIAPDLHQDSPVEPIYRLDGPAADPPAFYGYPFCFAAGNLTEDFENDPNVGTMYTWPTFVRDDNITRTDAWCRNRTNVISPNASLPAHTAPLAAEFDPVSQALYIALHGSWNRDKPVGYAVVRLPFNRDGTPAATRVTDTVLSLTAGPCAAGKSCFRPAGLAIVERWAYVASDETGEVVRFAL